MIISGPEEFQREFGVSRETVERLETYETLLIKWQKAQNLVAPNTLSEVWHRHFADSAQLFKHLDEAKIIVDMGAGGGFPGLVLGILLMERHGSCVHLVESNSRKCSFLKDVARQTGAHVEIHNCRIEVFAIESTISSIDVVTARALKPLNTLLTFGQALFEMGAKGIFLKGKGTNAEIEEASQDWHFHHETFESLTDPLGRIVKLNDIKPRS